MNPTSPPLPAAAAPAEAASVPASDHPVILFDGVCHLCAGAVQFILKRDRTGHIRFAPLQSPLGQSLLQQHGLDTQSMNSFVLVENGCAYSESSAALRITRHLSGLWPVLYVGLIIPPFLRNPVYRFIAKNRYRWFGKSDACMMPAPGWKERFLS